MEPRRLSLFLEGQAGTARSNSPNSDHCVDDLFDKTITSARVAAPRPSRPPVRSTTEPSTVAASDGRAAMTGQGEGQEGDQHHEWEEAVPASSGRPKPGDIITESGLAVTPGPMVGHDVSTPLEEDEPEHATAGPAVGHERSPTRAMAVLLPAHERHDRIRECLDADDYTLYCIDDGRHHAMIARRVGESPSGCEYSLLGRIARRRYEELRDEVVLLINCFDTATEIRLCGVDVEEATRSSNVFDVAPYDGIDDVPENYRPGSPFHHFGQEFEDHCLRVMSSSSELSSAR